MSNTPETDDLARGNHVVPTEWAEQLERERDEARDILSKLSHEFGFGLGDKTTPAQEYYERIREAFDFLKGAISKPATINQYDFICLERESHQFQKRIANLEIKNEELRNIIEALTKGKLPCNPDHNGECLVCDAWLCDCPLNKKETEKYFKETEQI